MKVWNWQDTGATTSHFADLGRSRLRVVVRRARKRVSHLASEVAERVSYAVVPNSHCNGYGTLRSQLSSHRWRDSYGFDVNPERVARRRFCGIGKEMRRIFTDETIVQCRLPGCTLASERTRRNVSSVQSASCFHNRRDRQALATRLRASDNLGVAGCDLCNGNTVVRYS